MKWFLAHWTQRYTVRLVLSVPVYCSCVRAEAFSLAELYEKLRLLAEIREFRHAEMPKLPKLGFRQVTKNAEMPKLPKFWLVNNFDMSFRHFSIICFIKKTPNASFINKIMPKRHFSYIPWKKCRFGIILSKKKTFRNVF